jgi:hypothetical protein
MNSKEHIMQQERDPLNLAGLPLVSPPADDWPLIEKALRAHQTRRRLWKVTAGALTAAASLAVAAGLVLHQAASPPVTEPALSQAKAAPAGGQAAAEAESGNNLASLISLSQRLESSLRIIRSEAGVMPTASLIYQVELEDLVAQVDGELSMNPASTTLWSQRVNLLLDLTQLHENQLRRESHRMASL